MLAKDPHRDDGSFFTVECVKYSARPENPYRYSANRTVIPQSVPLFRKPSGGGFPARYAPIDPAEGCRPLRAAVAARCRAQCRQTECTPGTGVPQKSSRRPTFLRHSSTPPRRTSRRFRDMRTLITQHTYPCSATYVPLFRHIRTLIRDGILVSDRRPSVAAAPTQFCMLRLCDTMQRAAMQHATMQRRRMQHAR